MDMTSHELARTMQRDAEYLLSKPEFKVPHPNILCFYWSDKDAFIAAVRATMPGRKDMKSESDVKFFPHGLTLLEFWVSKSVVCRKVQDVKYECEPFLSPDEEALMDEPVMVPDDGAMPESAERNGEI